MSEFMTYLENKGINRYRRRKDNEMQHQKLRMNNLKVVIFDWDNTLAETRTPLIYAINKILAEYKMPEWKEVKNLRDNNLSFRDNFPRLFGDKANEAYEKYVRVYLENVASLISTYEGAHEVLALLKKNNIILTIMSNKDRRLLEFEMPLLFEAHIFDKIVCGHEAKRDKPYPEHAIYTLSGYLKAEEINPETVWIVGDSPQDSICACAVNAMPIRLGYPIWGDEEKLANNILHYDSFCDFYQDLKEITI